MPGQPAVNFRAQVRTPTSATGALDRLLADAGVLHQLARRFLIGNLGRFPGFAKRARPCSGSGSKAHRQSEKACARAAFDLVAAGVIG